MPDELNPDEFDPKTPPGEGSATEEAPPESAPAEVLPPEGETPHTDPAAEPGEGEEGAQPTADELRQQLAEKDAEIARLREGQPVDRTQPPPGMRVSMAQTFLTQVEPEARKAYTAEKDPGRQFQILVDTADKLVGAVMADQVRPVFQQLAVANVELLNELAIRDLRSDPEFKAAEKQVRERLAKTDWKTRASETAVQDIFHAIRGAQRNGAPTKAPAKPSATPAARAVLKDLAAGGGASPKPAGVRLTPAQEKDFQALIGDGWPGDRKDYYAKWKARADQAKANNKPIPATYRG